MGIKLENEKNHKYFVDTAFSILNTLKFDYTYDEVEEMSINEGYLLSFKDKKITGRWNLGIWAVGEWGIKSEYEGEIYESGYGVKSYKPLTISVFLVHDWTFDKFRPTNADKEMLIHNNDNADKTIKELKYIFKHPIDSFYNIIAKHWYEYQNHEKNKYVTYFKAWYDNVYRKNLRRITRRIKGYIATHIFMVKSRFDKRVAYREYKFHKDKWNNEYEIAIVFRYGETEWDDWKAWFDYKTLFKKLYKWNIWVDFNYLDENGNMPEHIWRGVYWTEEPEKE